LDVHDFSDTTDRFVKFFLPDSNVKFENGYRATLHTPLQPLNTKEVDGYKFSTYYERANDHRYDNQYYFVRMGGVVYPHTTSVMTRRAFSNYVVVDVPIGKLSIPISREAIENTPLNDKVYKEIEVALDKIAAEETAALTVPKFGSIITGNTEFGSSYKGEWFKHNFKDCFIIPNFSSVSSKAKTSSSKIKNSSNSSIRFTERPNSESRFNHKRREIEYK